MGFGIFAALILAQMGFKPIVLERGKKVRERTQDTWGLWRQSQLNPESNVQFGEGGAGALSFAVRHMSIDWLKPARMDDMITVETRIGIIKGASLTLHQRILRGDEILMTAEVLVALVADGKPARISPDLRVKLQPNEGF